MVSITDCVVEGLKYPFKDIKNLLGIGVLFAFVSLISVFISWKSLDIFRVVTHLTENGNFTLSTLPVSQLPIPDIKFVIGLSIVSFIISLFIMGYQYNVVKFSIEKREDLPSILGVLDLLVKGIKYFIVTLAYNIIPLIVLILGVMLIGDSSILPVVILISALLFIIASFLVIMALNNMIAHDKLAKAFDLKEIIGNISNLGWGKYIGIIIFTLIVYMIIMVAASFILSFLTMIFATAINNQAFVISIVIAIIEGLFIDSYGAVFFNRVCGSIYNESINN